MLPESDDEGSFKREYTHQDVKEAFGTLDEAVILTSDIAEELGCSNETARRRLNDLYDDGWINKRTFGRQTVWWQLPPDTAEERPGRRLRRVSQDAPEPIVFGDIVYHNGETQMLKGEQAEIVESVVEEVLSDDE